MKTLTDLFPWSAEARIIKFILHERALNGNEGFFSLQEVCDGSGVQKRTLLDKYPRLVEMGVIERVQIGNGPNPHHGLRLAVDKPIVTALIKLESALFDLSDDKVSTHG